MTAEDTNKKLSKMTIGDMNNFRVDPETNELFWNNQKIYTSKRLDAFERRLAIVGVTATCASAAAISVNALLNYLANF